MSALSSVSELPRRGQWDLQPELAFQPPQIIAEVVIIAQQLLDRIASQTINMRELQFDLGGEARGVFCSKKFFLRQYGLDEPPIEDADCFSVPQESFYPSKIATDLPFSSSDDDGPYNSPCIDAYEDGSDADISSSPTPPLNIPYPCVVSVRVHNPSLIPFWVLFYDRMDRLTTSHFIGNGEWIRCLKGMSDESVSFAFGERAIVLYPLSELNFQELRVFVQNKNGFEPKNILGQVVPSRSFSPEPSTGV